ncbi:MAG: FtsX-like permease family protein [Calditrichaeota bacterium]|nr:FtsX-like permease family protein [Calditrichota bacterium]
MVLLVIKEILHRKINFLLGVLAIIMAVALFIAFFTSSEASKRETIRLTRDMGFNLRIIPKSTDMNDFWVTGFSKTTMPEKYVLRFKKFKNFSYAHLTATLHKQVTWRDKKIILTGISPEIEPSGKKKSPMIFSIQPGTVYLGYEVAKASHLKKGDVIDLFGKKLSVAKTLSENGSDDDIRVFAPLAEVQDILHEKGRINEIKALECLCLMNGQNDPLKIVRQQLTQVLPEAKVILNQTIAVARERQRKMFENYFALLLPFVVLVCAAWVGTLAMMNVRERKQEIGILRALGYSAGKITVLFLSKALLIGILGAVLGFIIGTALSLKFGPEVFKVTAKLIKPNYGLLIWSLIAAPLFTALASFIPAMIAVSTDPALTLRED